MFCSRIFPLLLRVPNSGTIECNPIPQSLGYQSNRTMHHIAKHLTHMRPTNISSYTKHPYQSSPKLSHPMCLSIHIRSCSPSSSPPPPPSPLYICCCNTILYTLAFSSVHTVAVLRSSKRRASSISAAGRDDRLAIADES